MEWIAKKMNEIENAIKEIETASLTNETKMVVLRSLKEELNLLNIQKQKIANDMDFVEKGFGK